MRFLPTVFLTIVIFYFVSLLEPALLGNLTGTFKPTTLPNEYLKLERFLSKDDSYYRTFWLPTSQRFAYYSLTHPILSSDRLFRTNDPKVAVKKLHEQKMKTILEELSVKYIIVPYDSEGEIFLEDRKYSDKLYQETVTELEKVDWLKRIEGFMKIAVFELENPKDHFWSPGLSSVAYQSVSPTEYRVIVRGAKKGDLLVFSEGFDRRWTAEGPRGVIRSMEYKERLNSFVLPEGNYHLKVYYSPQRYVGPGLKISLVALVFLPSLLLFGKISKKK